MNPHPLLAMIPATPHQQTLKGINSGLAGIRSSLVYMRRFVEEYKTDPTILQLARGLTRWLPQKDYAAEIDAVFSFVQNNIRYVRDINGVETIQTPVKTLELGSGDCDDKTTLLAALLESIGFETRFHAMGFRKNSVSHVLLEARLDGQWVALETTEPVSMGWIPPRIQTSIYR